MRRLALVASLLLAAPPAFADDTARAAELKTRGDEAMDSGHAVEALAAYVEAASLSKDPALLYNRGRAHWALGHYVEALADLTAFDVEAPRELRARVPGLMRMISELKKRVATVVVNCDVTWATVRLRGHVVGVCPLRDPLV